MLLCVCVTQERVQVHVLLGACDWHGGYDPRVPALGEREGHHAATGARAAQSQQPLLRPTQVPYTTCGYNDLPPSVKVLIYHLTKVVSLNLPPYIVKVLIYHLI